MAGTEMKFYSNRSPKKGYSWETPPAPVAESDIVETLEADVIIVGGGVSGLAAAARCSSKGLNCIVIDKNKHMVAVAGQIGVINTKLMAENGIFVDKKQLAADWLKVTGSRVVEELLWVYLNRSGEAFDWMMELTEGGVEPVIYVPYKGEMFREYFATHHISKKPDCEKYKNRGGGMLVCEILETEFRKNGGQVYRSTAAEQLEKDADGRVTAAVAICEDGKYRRYKGRKAVVLATGDASEDHEMLEAFCPTGLRASRQFPRKGNTGDGQKMAYWAGAILDNPEWAPTLHTLGYGGFHFFFLHVNKIGKRFMNEYTWMQAKSMRCLMQPGGDFAFSVFDSKWLDEIEARWDILGGQGMTQLSTLGQPLDRETLGDSIERMIAGETVKGNYGGDPSTNTANCYRADTIEGLAEAINVPVDAFCATVDRYNEIVASGDDTDFGKDSAMLTSMTKGPFYAIKWGPALLDVFGGALANTDLNVIDADGNTIPGLYVTGNAAGGMYAVDYPLLVNGSSYGRALAYAFQLADVLAD